MFGQSAYGFTNIGYAQARILLSGSRNHERFLQCSVHKNIRFMLSEGNRLPEINPVTMDKDFTTGVDQLKRFRSQIHSHGPHPDSLHPQRNKTLANEFGNTANDSASTPSNTNALFLDLNAF